MSLLAVTRVYRTGHAPVEALAACQEQRDAWAARFRDLADAVLSGTYKDYDVLEDSGGSTFLCSCSHDTDGWPHESWCGALLKSELPA